MGRAALRLIRADLRSRPGQALLTGLVIAIAAGTLVVTFFLRGAFDAPWEHMVRATAGPDVVVDGPPDEIARIARLPEVARADPVRPVVGLPIRIGGMPAQLTLTGLPPHPGLERPLVSAGRGLRGPGEVLLDPAVAFFHHVGPGAVITTGSGARQARLRIVGIAAIGRFAGGVWATADQVRALAPQGRVRSGTVPLRLRDPGGSAAFAASAPGRTHATGVRIGEARIWRADFTDSARRMVTILEATTLLSLLGAGFTLATAIGGRVIAQRRQVALLRAVGLTPLQATLLLVAFYAALALVAAPPGLALGALLAPGLLDQGALWGLTPTGGPSGGLVLAALGVTLLVVVAATALPAARAGRRSPVAGLALGRDVTTARASRLAALARRLHLPVVVGLGIKDAFAQRARSVLTLGSLALAAVVVVCALGFEATMNRVGGDSALRAQPWDVQVSSAGALPAELDRLVRRPEVEAVATIGELDLTATAAGAEVRARVIDGPLGPFRYAVPDGRGIERTGEVTAGGGLLETLHVRIGDRVRLEARGIPFSVRIVGRHVEPDAGGRAVVMSIASLPPAVRALSDDPDRVLRLRRATDAAAFAGALQRAGGGRVEVRRPIDSLRREASDLRPVVYSVCGLLVAIALVNLLTTLLLGLRERERDIAVLGAVGATPLQVAGSVLAGGAALAVPAALAGVPLGAWTFHVLIAHTDPSDGPDVATLPSLFVLAFALPAALLMAAAVSTLAARRAATVNPVRALRAE